ncbi:protein CBFA2T3-like isoform X1 [Penaeus chinensis]|uniref:protein CBFA2T3-like isoform X1 n=2 Tax=Penaeus chinensis TaxID=139456 RepID=UPI001FB848D9|nr:protein CBFA2T3-like isoform X1 [Penaeus chinensis]
MSASRTEHVMVFNKWRIPMFPWDGAHDEVMVSIGLRAEMPKLGETSTGSTGAGTGGSSSTASSANATSGNSGNRDNPPSEASRIPGPHPYSPVPPQKAYANGSYSPHSTVNGTPTPSPPALSSPPTHALDASAAAGAGARDTHRQISKVRRFLTTLHQFAADISPEVGDRVRHLVLGLLSGGVSVEEFHGGLQEVTHFPLRPFVLPFLRSHLPLLQRELQSLARRASMPVSQYVAVHEAALLEAAAGEPTDFFSSEVTSGKRRHEGYFENGDSGGGSGGSVSPPPAKRLGIFSPPYPSVGISPDLPAHARDYRTPAPPPDDEWKNIHVMLTCILSMVEKTRRALTMLQQKEDRDGGGAAQRMTAVGATDLRQRADYDAEVRRHAAELVAQSIRTTEERVSEVKRKAEEAVSEVRRAAVAEVQRAVGAAEARAQELVAAERAKVEALLREVGRRDPSEPRTEPQQACWNCGRKAHETCSGCNVARYCGPFCQHKDWDSHHKVCSPALASTSTSSSISSSSTSSSTAIIAALASKNKFSKGAEAAKSE